MTWHENEYLKLKKQLNADSLRTIEAHEENERNYREAIVGKATEKWQDSQWVKSVWQEYWEGLISRCAKELYESNSKTGQ